MSYAHFKDPAWRKFGFLALLFLLSILVRVPNLSRPLSKHHEYCTAHVLLTLKIWEEEGAAKFFYSPVANFGNPEDREINNITTGIVKRDGRYYYLSFPPLGFILPHFIFSSLGISVNPLSLKLLNIIFHGISAYFIYLIICLIAGWREPRLFIPAIVGFAAYLFAPTTLWFHGNGYMSDFFVNNWLIIGVWVALKIFLEKRHHSAKWFFYLALIVFLMTYTAWLGCLFAFAVFSFSIWRSREDLNFLLVALACTIGVILALGLTTWQYSLIDGFNTFLLYLENRFLDRSFTNKSIFKSLFYVMRSHLLTGYFPLLVWLVICYLLYIYYEKLKITALSKPFLIFLLLAGIPIFAHHIIFINYTTVHDFALLKTGLLISVCIGLLYHKITQKKQSKIIPISMLGVLLLCITQYYVINQPGAFNQNGDRYDYMEKIGLAVKDNAQADDAIFMSGYKPNTQILYYAERNIIRVENFEEAKNILNERSTNSGLYIEVKDKSVNRIERFETDQSYDSK